MRLVVQEYAKGGRTAFETSDDGAKLLAEWGGMQRVGERLSAFVEVACEEQAIDRLLDALDFLAKEIKQRQQQLVSAANHQGP